MIDRCDSSYPCGAGRGSKPLGSVLFALSLLCWLSLPSPRALAAAPPVNESPPQSSATQADEDIAWSDCAGFDANDSRTALLERLASLAIGNVKLDDCRDLSAFGIPDGIEAKLLGQDHALINYVLTTLAREGYWIELTPLGENVLHLVARTASGLGGGLRFVRTEKVQIEGEYLAGDDEERIRRIIAISNTGLAPELITERLADLGYGIQFVPVQRGQLRLKISPTRRIRRVDFHRHLPIPERDLLSQLSLDARPGALVRGRCSPAADARKAERATSPCATNDFACLEWERYEQQRIDRYLFDSGYLRGRSRLALACGRRNDEATLHVHIDRGPSYKVDRNKVEVRSEELELSDALRRQIQRDFVPRRTWFFDGPLTRSFIQDERESLQRNFAEPTRGIGKVYFRNIPPYPEASVTTSYDNLTRAEVGEERELPLNIEIRLGRAVATEYYSLPAALHTNVGPASRAQRGKPKLAASDLDEQLQLFKRGEPPSPATALRESGYLRAYLQEEGYLLAQVSGEYEEGEAKDFLRFAIDEGPRVRIREVELRHPSHVPKDIAAAIEQSFFGDSVLRRGQSFTDTQALEDITTLLEAYGSHGYLCARVQVRIGLWQGGLDETGGHGVLTPERVVDGVGRPAWVDDFVPSHLAALRKQKRSRAYLRFEIDAGPRIETAKDELIRHLAEPIPPTRYVEENARKTRALWGTRRTLSGTRLRNDESDGSGGIPVSLDLDRELPSEIVTRYAESGFPIADVALSWQWSDPDGALHRYKGARDLAADPEGICDVRGTRQVEVTPVLDIYEGRRARFGDALIRGNFKTKTPVLRRQLQFAPGDAFSQRAVVRSKSRLDSLGVTQRVQFVPHATDCRPDDRRPCLVHHVVKVEESDDLFMNVAFGMGTATLNPLYFFIRPKLPNLFGSAWDLEGEASYGVDFDQLRTDFHGCLAASCFDRRARLGLLRPQIGGSIVDLDIGTQYQQRVTPARGELRSFASSVRASWPLRGGWKLYGGYRFQLANASKPAAKPQGGATGLNWIARPTETISNNSGLLEFGLALSRLDNPFNPSRGYQLNVDGKMASKWLGGHDWWSRIDILWQQFIPITRFGDRFNFRYSLRFGQLFPLAALGTEVVPEVWRYFGGGSFDLGVRGIQPETMLSDIQEIPAPFGGVVLRPRARGGHIRAIGTIALQVISLPDVLGGKLGHSVFYDFGILTHFWRDFDLRREWRHSVGINALKLDINIVTFAVGYALLLPPNIRDTDDRNGRLIFDIGITF